MNAFEITLLELQKEGEELQKMEFELQSKSKLYNQKMLGFFKEHGVPENFTIPQMALLAIRQARK